jgi:hypothetical protein
VIRFAEPDRTGPDPYLGEKYFIFASVEQVGLHHHCTGVLMISYFSKNSRLASKRAKDKTVCIDGPK